MLNNEKDNVVTSLTALKNCAVKILPESEGAKIGQHCDNLRQAYQTAESASTTINKLNDSYRMVNLDAWNFHQITDILLVLHKLETKLREFGCDEMFIKKHSIFLESTR